ncbi:unnamed protein product, partial [Brassica rapa subsp. trilocularis]
FSISLEENFEYMFNMLDKVSTATSRVKAIPWTLWSIWKNCNAILYAATQESQMRLFKLIAELRCIIWVLHSVRDLHFDQICIASDHKDTIAGISSPNQWPRYRFLFEKINHLNQSFSMVSFEEENISANLIARDIAKSVLRDGRFQSYLAMGGPAWLHERLHREAMYNS